jgi:predicted tellurium resistance membrane protein TerC
MILNKENILADAGAVDSKHRAEESVVVFFLRLILSMFLILFMFFGAGELNELMKHFPFFLGLLLFLLIFVGMMAAVEKFPPWLVAKVGKFVRNTLQ